MSGQDDGSKKPEEKPKEKPATHLNPGSARRALTTMSEPSRAPPGSRTPTTPGMGAPSIEEKDQSDVESEETGGGGSSGGRRRDQQRESPSSGSPPSAEGLPKSRSTSPDEALEKRKERVTEIELVPRPGVGSAGRKIMIIANHYKIIVPKGLQFSQYVVDIGHAFVKLNRDDKRTIFWNFIQQRLGDNFGRSIIYDGDKICVTRQPLDFLENAAAISNFTYDLILARFGQVKTFSVKFQYVGQVNVSMRDVETANPVTRNTTPLNILDILFRQQRSCPIIEASRAWYPFAQTVYRIPGRGDRPAPIGFGQVLWQGLFGSARLGTDYTPFINFDISHSPFVNPSHLLEFICDVLNSRMGRGRYQPAQINNDTELSPEMLIHINRELKGLAIVTDFKDGNGQQQQQREHRTDGLIATNALNTTFELRGDPVRQISVNDYYKERYNYILKYPKFQVLSAGSKRRPIYLPMEVCYLRTCQKSKKKLTPDQTSEVIRVTATTAEDRMKRTTNLFGLSGFDQDGWLRAAGIDIEKEMTRLPARVLQPLQIECARKKMVTVNVERGAWDQKREGLLLGKTIGQMGAIIIDKSRVEAAKSFQFLGMLLAMCKQQGITIQNVIEAIVLPLTATEEDIEVKLQQLLSTGTNLIVVVIPAKNSPAYGMVKRPAEINLGVMTQCVTKQTAAKTVDKNDQQVTFNIALKINAKMGGIDWHAVEKDAEQVLREKKTVVLGIDVTHPGPTETRMPSIGGIVGNVDATFMQYAGNVVVQKHRRESVILLSQAVRQRLVEYNTKTKDKPERIIVFRDGVADSQFKEVLDEELTQIREACKQLGSNYNPPITFIVAQKRHHTRFFPVDRANAIGRSGNIPLGTVVDTVITHPKYFEFYLCSHNGIQGTSRPIRYNVLTDDNAFKADQIQKMTHYLAHCFSRCTRPVSLPAPLYYADLICRRARVHLQLKIGDFSSDTMSTASGGSGDGSGVSEDVLVRAATVVDSIGKTMYFT